MIETNQSSETFMTRMAAANRYGVSLESIKLWQKLDGFPKDAIDKRFHPVLVDVAKVDAWLRSKPISDMGRPPHWWRVIWGDASAEEARAIQRKEQSALRQGRRTA
jgi:hypothetical protein